MTTRGVVDLVLCLDASESMRPCFEGVRRHLNDFVRGLAAGGQQQEFDVRVDFLAHSCGQNGPFQASSLRYHDGLSLIRALYEPQGGTGFFTSDLPEIERALAGVQVAGDEAPLVAIDVALDYPWRPRNKCHRAMIYLTDEPFESGTGVYDAVTLQHQLAKIPDIIQKFPRAGRDLVSRRAALGRLQAAFDDREEPVQGCRPARARPGVGRLRRAVEPVRKVGFGRRTADYRGSGRRSGAIRPEPVAGVQRPADRKVDMPEVHEKGQKVGQYVIEEQIHSGGMALSYKAHLPGGQHVFLKQYIDPSVLVPWYRAYLKYQDTIKARVEASPFRSFTCRFIEFFEFDHCYYQAIEFIDASQSLEKRLERAATIPLTWMQRLTMAKVIVGAVKLLHELKIIHADLKPANVILTDSKARMGYQLKLIDLDFSILADVKAPWHGDYGYFGTPGYFSPEHMRGQTPVAASDVFTCGLILYELLAARGNPIATRRMTRS